MTLLLGDETTTYAQSSYVLTNGDIFAWQFTALESGTVDTLEVFAGPTVPYSDTSHLFLAVYTDIAGAPGDLVGSVVTWVGVPSVGSWLGGSGAAADVVALDTYWLVAMSYGDAGPGNAAPIYLATAHGDDNLGTAFAQNSDESHATIPATWPGTIYSDASGPVAFRALGTVAVVTAGPITGLDWHVTGLWYPGDTSTTYYGRVADPQEGEVVIPLNDSRTAKVTLSVHDPLVADVVGHAYARALKCYYHGTLVFWGIIKLPEVDMDAGTVTVNAVDPGLRAIRHYLRRGDLDGALSAPNGDRANVSIDHVGLRLLLDAARNIPGQTTRGCPDIGIAVGTNDFVAAPDDLMGVARGDEVWNAMLQDADALGPDFELEPLDATVGAYCQLNTYTRQGTDKSATVQWHYGTGLDNLANLAFTEGGQYVTHVHVLSRDQAYRFTRVNVEASAETGQYTIWDATDFDSHGIPAANVETVLNNYGDELLRAYGRPLIAVTLTLLAETDDSYRYLADYALGDTVDVAGLAGYAELPASDYRITRVTLTQADETNAVQPSVDVVADRATGDTITGDE